MKKFNVYSELRFIIASIPFFISMILGIVFGLVWPTFNVIYFLSALLAFITGIILLVIGVPNTLNYYYCKSSLDFGKATVVDKFEKISKNENRNNKWIIVLEYRINGICYKSVNIVPFDIAKDLEIKSTVDVSVSRNMALFIKKD